MLQQVIHRFEQDSKWRNEKRLSHVRQEMQLDKASNKLSNMVKILIVIIA